jgi:hypothetical protein
VIDDMSAWPHRDFPLSLMFCTLEVGTTILLRAGVDERLLRVIEELRPGSWRVRPTTSARPLNAEYRRRQRTRAKRRRR